MSDILNDIVKLHAIVKEQDLLSVSFISSNKLLIIDAETSANRLYGDKFNEWVCGGCWNKMFYSLKDLVFLIRKNGFDLVVLFNGSLDVNHIMEWSKRQSTTLQQVYTIQQHLQVNSNEFKAPARALQLAPPSLACALRLALQRLNVRVIQTFDNHFLEVGALCAELGATFLLSTNLSTLLMASPDLHLIFPDTLELQLNPRRLSAGLLNTDQLARALNLHPTRLPIFTVLLGGVPHLLPITELQLVHAFLLDSAVQQHLIPSPMRLNATPISRTAASYQDALVQVVCNFLRQINDNLARSLDTLALSLFGQCCSSAEQCNRLCNAFVSAVKYICSGASLALQELRLRRRRDLVLPELKQSPGAYPKSVVNVCPTPLCSSMNGVKSDGNRESIAETALNLANLSIEHSESTNSSNRAARNGVGKCVSWARDVISPTSRQSGNSRAKLLISRTAHSNAMLIQVEQRHRAGLLHPWVFQVLTERTIKVTNGLEEDLLGEWSGPPGSAIDLFRPLRRAAYAVLLNARRPMEQGNGASEVEPEVSEWVVRPGTISAVCEIVLAKMPPHVLSCMALSPPTCEMLWLGSGASGGGLELDRLSCMHAFLHCMHIGGVFTPRSCLLDTSRVPPPLLLYCSVLRYLLFQGVLRPSELEAALSVAISPTLLDVRAQRDLRLERLCPRAVRLSALVMRAIENAIFVNDACATPIPREFTDPFLYFDGRLFLFKLEMTSRGANLLQLCENQMELLLRVERMRAAIFESLESACLPPTSPAAHMPRWSFTPTRPCAPPVRLDQFSSHMTPPQPVRSLIVPNSCLPFSFNNFASATAPRDSRFAAVPTCLSSHVDYGGGALEVGGIVVANWAPNLTTARGNKTTDLASAALASKDVNLHNVSRVAMLPTENNTVIAQSQSPGSAPGGPPLCGPPAGPPGCPPIGILQSSPNRVVTQTAARGGRRRRRGVQKGGNEVGGVSITGTSVTHNKKKESGEKYVSKSAVAADAIPSLDN